MFTLAFSLPIFCIYSILWPVLSAVFSTISNTRNTQYIRLFHFSNDVWYPLEV
jgi:hypothetical protein